MNDLTGIRGQSIFLVLAWAVLAAGCGDDAATSEPDSRTLELELEGLSALGDDYVYEGWLIVDGAPVSTGRFDVVAGQSSYRFEIPRETSDAATTFVLTIEPAVGDDPAPADTHVLAGDLIEGSASLSVDHGAALGTDFGSATGSYILETPTTAMEPADYAQGIWFLDPADGMTTLDLPVLPAGWVYEGWVVGEDGPISTGRFTDASMADSDGGGPAAGSDGSPPFPGQDFIDPALVLSDLTAVISLEPEPDNSAAPFDVKPLIDEIMDVGAGVTQEMAVQSASSLPSGSARLE